MSLRNRFLKARCSISMWGNLRKDRVVEKEVAQAKHVKAGKAGKWQTNLLAGADTEYEAAVSALGAVRDFHYENTYPWEHGAQALPNERFLAYAKGIGQLKGIAEQRLQEFFDVYEERVKQAQENSPDLTGVARYPSLEELQRSCGCTVEIGPMPDSGDLRLAISDAEAQKLLEEQRLRMDTLADERVQEAKREMFRRLHKLLTNAKRNLGVTGSEGRYREEWYDNLAAFCEAADEMNFDKDPEFNKLVEDVKTKVLADGKEVFSKKENKDDFAESRQSAEEEVDDILARMSGIF